MRRALKYVFIDDRKSFQTTHLIILVILILLIVAIYYPRNFEVQQRLPLFWDFTLFEFRTTTFGVLFVIPLIYAAVFLNIKTLIATWLVCGALMLPRITDLSFHIESLIRAYSVYTIPFFIALLIRTEIMWRAINKKSAAEKEEQRQKYLSQVFKAHENERKNIARELHDGVIQSLIVLTNHAQGVIAGKNRDGHGAEAEKEINGIVEQIVALRDLSRDISKDIRDICLNLRPYIIDDMGLIPALRWLINRTKTDVNIALTTDGEERRFDPETELMIYRILQEAINNINHHSLATKANIRFYFQPDALKISIEDNGKGFVFPEKISTLTEEGKLGLIGMQERVKFLNGDIKINSQLGQGTSITIDAAI
jgi:two-component system, NarL family, sensor histidine kinase DegS